MPLALLYSWVCGKLWGTQEWQLRAVNLLWGALALAAMSRVGRRLQLPWLPLLLAIQPFFWFYQNEARPYALQIAGGAWLLAALVEFQLARAAGVLWAWLLVFAAVLLFYGTLLAPVSVAATVLAGIVMARSQGWKPERSAILVLLAGLAACVPAAIYYLTTLLRGAKGAQAWHVDLKFFAYVIYEFTGMGGLGLSDEQIRELARSPSILHDLLTCAPQIALPLLLAVLLLSVLYFGLRGRWPSPPGRPLVMGFFIVLTFTAGVFIAGSLVLQKAFWARHYAPVFPFYVALLGMAFAGLWTTPRPSLRVLPLAFCALCIFSAANFRWAPSLRKEDYRSAAAFARQALADGKSVWWQAGGLSASYYGLACAYTYPEPGKIFVAYHSRVDIQTLPPPDVIVFNKPYIHDPRGDVQKIIVENHYQIAARFQSFTIWTNTAAP
jgi:hypothetical protein